MYYAPTIFQQAGFASANSAILATSVVGVVNVIATIIAVFLVDKTGRRVLLLVGTTAMVVALVILGTIFALSAGRNVGFLTLILYIFASAISMGPVFWLMSAEIFPTRVRAAGASACSFANWTANFLVSLTFLSLMSALGQSLTFWLYAFLGVLAFVFCLQLVPETKGRTLEQIEQYWSSGAKLHKTIA